MRHYLTQRVELLRKIENLRTIEDAFPRVKVDTQEEKAEVDAAELIRMFNAGKIGIDQRRAAGESMKGSSDELTDEELNAYQEARAKLAIERGEVHKLR